MKKQETVEVLECPRSGFCLHHESDCTDTGAESRDFACFENSNVSAGVETGHDAVMADGEITITEDFVFVCGETSDSFKRLMPVAVEEHVLADYGKEMARLQTLWVKTKLAAKAFAKSSKEITDHAEEDLLNLAQIIEAGTEEREIDCYWSFDASHGLKRLFRCDTGEMVAEETMTANDLQRDLSFDQSVKNVEAMTQKGGKSESSDVEDAELVDGNTTTAENLFDGPESDSGASGDEWPEPPEA